jgi:hypothetical protein
VPFLDLQAQYAPLRAALCDAMTRVADSQRFIMGPMHPYGLNDLDPLRARSSATLVARFQRRLRPDRSLALPIYAELTEAQQAWVVKCVAGFYQ